MICREVIEHLTVLQVRQTVAQLCRASSRFVYATTRFHPDPTGLLDFTTQFDVDPTHITLLTKPFLRSLFVLEGFQRRADLEEPMDWGKQGPRARVRAMAIALKQQRPKDEYVGPAGPAGRHHLVTWSTSPTALITQAPRSGDAAPTALSTAICELHVAPGS